MIVTPMALATHSGISPVRHERPVCSDLSHSLGTAQRRESAQKQSSRGVALLLVVKHGAAAFSEADATIPQARRSRSGR